MTDPAAIRREKQRHRHARLAVLASQRDDLLAACEALDEFQREYQANTGDDMPGNELYANKLMSIVEQSRAAIARATRGEGDDGQ